MAWGDSGISYDYMIKDWLDGRLLQGLEGALYHCWVYLSFGAKKEDEMRELMLVLW